MGVEAANEALAAFGTRLWPIDLTAAPGDVRTLLARPKLTSAEVVTVREAFLLPRERLLEVIVASGREPSVPDGGELSTLDVANNVTYPQLYIVEAGVDYSRFDRLHQNKADDGTELDEVLSILSGSGVRLIQRLADGSQATLQVDCVDGQTGWLLSYGGHPHIGSFTGASPGTKVLVQAIGPARWQARYTEGA
ncbi:hypothetical protein DK389_24300 [Methylobacterium durans]|uniref:Uncharacterized protein n=1 Tax=Methylobacterium durans TaxID=2202825 RepID=A0A2U8WBR5_9HYPH|nr:hypothetical protein DK389_24300 [Methylobacterium durans]